MNKVYIVSSTHHMGMDGDYTEIVCLTRDKNKAQEECDKIEALPYEDYNWYSGDIEEWELV
jgi:uncharacterized protein (UPF0333 family)